MTEPVGRNVVFFSGGLDSTLIAVDLLRSQKSVTLVTFDNGWIGGNGQQNKEKMRRKQIVRRMKTEFSDNMIDEKVYTWDGDLKIGIQKDIWVSLFPLTLESNDKAFFGIIRYSDFWHFRTKWENAFNAILDAHDKKGITLEYPLEWSFKKDIIKRLKKVGYYDLAIHSGDKL